MLLPEAEVALVDGQHMIVRAGRCHALADTRQSLQRRQHDHLAQHCRLVPTLPAGKERIEAARNAHTAGTEESAELSDSGRRRSGI